MNKQKKLKTHTTFSFPTDLLDEVKEIISTPFVKGYRNKTEFIVDATRQYLKETKKFIIEEQKRKDYEESMNIH